MIFSVFVSGGKPDLHVKHGFTFRPNFSHNFFLEPRRVFSPCNIFLPETPKDQNFFMNYWVSAVVVVFVLMLVG
jgi:hypothetical protein